MAKEYSLYIKGKAVSVSEDVYKVYWKIIEHEKYLQKKDWKYGIIPFSSLDHDGHFADNIVDESIDVAKIVETQIMIEALRNAISVTKGVKFSLCKVNVSFTSFTLIRDIAYLCKKEDVKKIPFKYLFFDN